MICRRLGSRVQRAYKPPSSLLAVPSYVLVVKIVVGSTPAARFRIISTGQVHIPRFIVAVNRLPVIDVLHPKVWAMKTIP